jgi:chromosome partitioning protein
MAQGKVIALMNQKGGVGKTTMAFNLAHALKEQGKKVLCLDLDPQFNLTSFFGIDPTNMVHSFHLLINSIKELKPLHVPNILHDFIQRTSSGIDLIPAGQELSGFELTVAGIRAPRQLILKKMLERFELRSLYDVIVIDGPPTLGLIVVNILSAADGVLYPFVPDSFSQQGLKNIQQVVRDIEEMEITSVPKNLGYIPNLFDHRRKQMNQDLMSITQSLDSAFVFSPFSNKVQFIKSQAAKKSVFEYKQADFKDLQDQFRSMAKQVEKELYE